MGSADCEREHERRRVFEDDHDVLLEHHCHWAEIAESLIPSTGALEIQNHSYNDGRTSNNVLGSVDETTKTRRAT